MQLVTLITAAIAGASAVFAAPMPPTTPKCDSNTIGAISIANYLKSANVSLTPLDPPAPTDKLLTVVLGIGTQNYSCSAGVPVPNGAFANLYDVTCLIALDAAVAPYLPETALHIDPSYQSSAVALAQNFLNARISSGVHYFKGDFATPAFELTVSRENNKAERFYGSVFQKLAAPSGADMGKNDLAYGAVPYLKLMPKAGMGSTLSTIYRVATAGGMQPGTCNWTGQKLIPYSALYYVYKSG